MSGDSIPVISSGGGGTVGYLSRDGQDAGLAEGFDGSGLSGLGGFGSLGKVEQGVPSNTPVEGAQG